MRPQLLELRFLFPMLVAGVLISTPLAWAQGTQPPGQIPVRLFDPRLRLVPGPEPDAPLRRPLGTLPRYSGHDPFSFDDKGGLRLPRLGGMSVPPGRTKGFPAGAWNRWFSFSPAFGQRAAAATRRPDDLAHYSQHLPLAGPLILRAHQQARAHPQVTRVLKLLAPAAQ